MENHAEPVVVLVAEALAHKLHAVLVEARAPVVDPAVQDMAEAIAGVKAGQAPAAVQASAEAITVQAMVHQNRAVLPVADVLGLPLEPVNEA